MTTIIGFIAGLAFVSAVIVAGAFIAYYLPEYIESVLRELNDSTEETSSG
jgi:hypothetical protein